MTGVHIVMGGDRSPHLSYVQAAGQGLRASADDIREAMRASGSLRENFLRFGQAFMTQTAHTAVANGRATIEERLARWILMAQDRVDGNDLMLTHEFLALMLNVRRAGVTEALNVLSKKGLISANRGQIRVLDRPRLEAAANGFYGIPEAEYQRLIGRPLRHGSRPPRIRRTEVRSRSRILKVARTSHRCGQRWPFRDGKTPQGRGRQPRGFIVRESEPKGFKPAGLQNAGCEVLLPDFLRNLGTAAYKIVNTKTNFCVCASSGRPIF